MNFKQGLNEYSDNIPLKKWNALQKIMWYDLCDMLKIEKNDVDKFTKFASFFDSYYKQTKKFPTLDDASDAVLEEGLFTKTLGHYHTVHTEKRNQYSDKKINKKNKKTAPKVQKADDTVHMRDYAKTLKSGGKRPYLAWVHNIKTTI